MLLGIDVDQTEEEMRKEMIRHEERVDEMVQALPRTNDGFNIKA